MRVAHTRSEREPNMRIDLDGEVSNLLGPGGELIVHHEGCTTAETKAP
jgi:hypothetical protein